MDDEAGSQVDMVVFLDANMPKMDQCGSNCGDKELVLCEHRFIFRAHAIHSGKALEKLDDFQVLQYFFKRIHENKDWQNAAQKPFFVLVTKDEDFIENDAPAAYRKAVKAKKNEINLVFSENYASDGVDKIIVVEIPSKNCGINRQHNLRCTIRELNKLWLSLEDNPR